MIACRFFWYFTKPGQVNAELPPWTDVFFINTNFATLYGIVKRIQIINPDFDLKIGGADTNLKKGFPTIGNILLEKKEPRDFVNTIRELSPLFIDIILNQIDGLTMRKLGEILGIENLMDTKIVKDELTRLKGTLFRHEYSL